MTPEQALSILAQAAQLAHMPAQMHHEASQAAQLLAEFIKLQETPATEPKND